MDWTNVRDAALEILRYSMPTADSNDLDRIILSTGYPWAKQPFKETQDLIAVYAANLRNGGGPGPSYQAFSEMIVFSTEKFIKGNRLSKSLDKRELAKDCSDYLKNPKSRRLSHSDKVDYIKDLDDIVDQIKPRERALIPKLLDSVVEFSKIFLRDFNGSAEELHKHFSHKHFHLPDDSSCFLLNEFKRIEKIPLIGVATAMNFFKDSQVPALLNKSLDNIKNNKISWFIKPDIHVMRFMLKATGRVQSNESGGVELFHMPENKLKKIYDDKNPEKNWAKGSYSFISDRRASERGQWKCIEDVHRLARCLKITPLEIDRVLYMVGSGRFNFEMPQVERYKLLFRSLDTA
jgi:hypothetical protein